MGTESRLTNYVTELDYIFAVPTRKHMSYQTGTVLPYWIKTQIFRRKVRAHCFSYILRLLLTYLQGLTPPKLYTFNDEAADVDKIVGTGKLGTGYAAKNGEA